MIRINQIINKKSLVIQKLKARGIPSVDTKIEDIIAFDQQRKKLQNILDDVLHNAKNKSQEIGEFMKSGNIQAANEAKKNTASLKKQIAEFSEKLKEVQQSLRLALYELPNIPNQHVPEGSSVKDNEVIEEFGEVPQLSDNALPHWELIKKYDIIDFELGTKITGAGFPIYKGKGAKLQRGLVNFFLDQAHLAGYDEVQPPILVNQESGMATGQLPDKEGQMYEINAESFYLIPTAEVPITNMFRDTIVKPKDLPLKKVGYSPCFRREAGSWGTHVRGLNRLHQFDKVEIVQVTLPEHSYQVLEDMRQYVQKLLKLLNLPTRVLNLCTGDLGFTSAQTYDMEVFSAAQKQWLEVSSVSNFETFQSNRLKLRYKNATGKTTLLHTLNGSALALPRIIAAILENNQTDKGILIPEILVPYLGFDYIQ